MPRQEGETLNLGDTEPSNFSLQKLSWTQTIFQVRMRCNKSKSLLSFFKKCGYLHDNAVSLSTSFCFGFKTENVNISGFGLRKLRHKIVNKSYQLLIRYRSENQNKNSQKLFHNPEVLSFLGCQHWYRLMSRNQGEEFFKFKGGVSCKAAAEKSKFFWKIIALRSKGMLETTKSYGPSDKHLDSNPQTMHIYWCSERHHHIKKMTATEWAWRYNQANYSPHQQKNLERDEWHLRVSRSSTLF